MEKDGIFNTDLNSLIGDTPIEVDGVGEGLEIPAEPVRKTKEKEKEPEKVDEDEGLIDLEKIDEEEVEEEDVTEEEEDKPSSNNSQKKPSSSPLTPYAKLLKEEGILPNLDMEKFDGSSDSLKQAMVDEIIEAVEMYKGSLPDRLQTLIDNYEEGVPLEKLLQMDKDETEVNQIDEDKVKEDSALQKQVVKNYLKRTTKFSDKKIDNMIQYYEDSGELEDEAVSAASELKEITASEREKAVEKAKADQVASQKRAQEELAELHKKVQGIQEIIPGMKVNDKIKNELVKSLTVPAGRDRSGNPVNRIVAARMENPMEFEIKLHYLFEVTKGFTDFSKLVEKGKKDSIKEFERAVESQDKETEGTVITKDTKASKRLIDSIQKTFNI